MDRMRKKQIIHCKNTKDFNRITRFLRGLVKSSSLNNRDFELFWAYFAVFYTICQLGKKTCREDGFSTIRFLFLQDICVQAELVGFRISNLQKKPEKPHQRTDFWDREYDNTRYMSAISFFAIFQDGR